MPNLTTYHVEKIKSILSGQGRTALGDPRNEADLKFGRTLEAKGFRYTHSDTLDEMRVDHYARLDDLTINAMVIEHEGTYFLIERVPDTQH